MLFNSINFVFLVIITFSIYYLLKNRNKQVFLLILASMIFYAFNHLEFLWLLIFSSLVNALTSYQIMVSNEKQRKIFAVMGVIFNLGLLAFFKYSSLLYKTFFTVNSFGEFILTLPLPVGISFYTFQAMSNLIDTFKSNERPAKKNVSLKEYLLDMFFFISFFPQLVAGPIVKAHDFFPQIGEKYFKNIQWEYAFKKLVLGYFLKMVIADNIQQYTFWISYPYFQEFSTITLIVMLFGYSIQIFADFAGYSFIAMGLAALFGYVLPLNFNFPYIASSFSDFWSRWHISLSAWLKEYLYIPLGGNRKGSVRTYLNLMVVMFLGGLWHGAAWSYLVWGGVHGCILAVERYVNQYLKQYSWTKSSILKIIKIIFVFSVVSWAWLLFKLPIFEHVVLYTKAIFNNMSSQHNKPVILYIFLYSIPVVIYHLIYLLRGKIPKLSKYEPIFYGIMIFLILMNSGENNAFIYFQF